VQRAAPEVGGAQGSDGGRLAGLLRDLPCEGFERSFKLLPGALLADRVLFGIPRAAVAAPALLRICTSLAMPAPFLEAIGEQLAGADTVHFGHESGGAGIIYKVYLEFSRRLAGAHAGEPILLHLAYKWDAVEPERRAVARYVCHPGLPVADILSRITKMGGDLAAPVEAVVTLAADRASEPLMYLEVSEDGNPRASYDVNVHAAGLRLRDVEPQMRLAQRRLSIPGAAFERQWTAVQGEKLGHLAGGRSRDGAPFMTVYHQVAPRG